jgi:hypothetical protein
VESRRGCGVREYRAGTARRITKPRAPGKPFPNCHLDRQRRSNATEEEWRDLEDACATMSIQGVLTECRPKELSWNPRACLIEVPSRVSSTHERSGVQRITRGSLIEHLVSVWQRTHRRDLSTTASGANASSASGRDDSFRPYGKQNRRPLPTLHSGRGPSGLAHSALHDWAASTDTGVTRSCSTALAISRQRFLSFVCQLEAAGSE